MPKIIDKKKKARDISDAAIKVFRDLGYHKTRMADIAAAAGMGKGTLYEYFRDKDDILRFAFEQYFFLFSKGVISVIETEDEPAKKLIALIDFALSHAAEWEDHCIAYIDYFSSARSESETFSLSAMYDYMKDLLITIIEEGQLAGKINKGLDPPAAAEVFVSIYDGIILHRLFEGSGIDRESIRKVTLEVLKSGLLVHD